MTEQTKCPSCGLNVPQLANCPRCGRVLKRSSRPLYFDRAVVIASLSLTVLVYGIYWFVFVEPHAPGTAPAPNANASTVSQSSSGPSLIGSEAQIGQRGQATPSSYFIGLDDDALSEFNHALSSADQYGALDLIARGRVIGIPPGTRVQIIDASFFMRKVRVLEGDHAGSAGWIEMEHVSPAESGPR